MTWAKIDDLMPEHPKVLALSSDAFRVHIAAICYASRNLTDGAIMDTALPSLRATSTIVQELKRAKLWERERGKGWRIHDFLDYNPSRVQVLAQRQERAEAGRRGGQAAAIARAKAAAIAGTTPLASSPDPTRTRPVGSTQIGRSVEDIDPSSVRPTMREPDASLEPPAATDSAPQSSPPTDRSPPPAVQDGECYNAGCPCRGTMGERHYDFERGEGSKLAKYGPPPISDATRQAIANLLGYPVAGKKITRMLTGQVEWCAGATEEHWQELIERATNGKHQPERTADGSIREGWVRTTLQGIVGS